MTPVAWAVLGVGVAVLVVMSAGQLALARAAKRAVGAEVPAGSVDLPASGPAIVYFHSPTCGPCRAMTPIMTALRDAGRPVVSVDVHARPDVAGAFGVMATPTTLVVRDGRVQDVLLGPLARGRVEELLSAG